MTYIDPEKQREATRVWKENNKEKQRVYNRKSTLKSAGWTPEMFDTTLVEQGGRCMICRQEPKPKNNKQGGQGGLVPDHKHTEPPEPRALLCHPCNIALGLFLDNPEVCRAAAEYLEDWA